MWECASGCVFVLVTGCVVCGWWGWGRVYVCHNDIVGVRACARETSPIAQHVTCITLGYSWCATTRENAPL